MVSILMLKLNWVFGLAPASVQDSCTTDIPDGERQTTKTTTIAMPNFIFVFFIVFSLQILFYSSSSSQSFQTGIDFSCQTLSFYRFDMQIIWEGLIIQTMSEIYPISFEGLHTVIQSIESKIYRIIPEPTFVKIYRKSSTFLNKVKKSFQQQILVLF